MHKHDAEYQAHQARPTMPSMHLPSYYQQVYLTYLVLPFPGVIYIVHLWSVIASVLCLSGLLQLYLIVYYACLHYISIIYCYYCYGYKLYLPTYIVYYGYLASLQCYLIFYTYIQLAAQFAMLTYSCILCLVFMRIQSAMPKYSLLSFLQPSMPTYQVSAILI